MEKSEFPCQARYTFDIASRNSDANCFRKRHSYSRRLVISKPSMCENCVYNKKPVPLFLLSYFDEKENTRLFYMNRTGWESEEGVLKEYETIQRNRKTFEARGVFGKDSYRSKWAIERLDPETKKVTLYKKLEPHAN